MRTNVLPGVLALTGFLAAGCEATEEWVKPGTSDVERDRDVTACLTASQETIPSAQGPRRVLNQDRYRRCMNERGYTVKKAGE